MSDLTPPTADIVARADKMFRLRRYLIVLLIVGVGGWFCYDGFYNWPRQKRDAEAAIAAQEQPKEKPRSETDILANQVLGVVLPPVGLLVLAWFIYTSRGEYRLSGQTLSVPGHPAIPLAAITLIDKSKWDRKGIVRIEYEPSPGKTSSLRLDDFVYERVPTDQILHRLEASLAAADQQANETKSNPGS